MKKSIQGTLSSNSSHFNSEVLGRQRPGLPWLWLLVGFFLSLGVGYIVLTPIFENSDETLHYPYVKHLADGQGLPLAIPGQLWNQEGTQPPLYYAIVAATTFWIDSDNLPELLQPNPHWRFTEVRALINDNQNLVLHGPMDRFPYRQAALAVILGRSWSLIFGTITVIFTFLIGQQLFSGHPALIVTATALAALTPQFIRVSATVSNDSLAAALTATTVWLALKFTEPQSWSREAVSHGQAHRQDPFSFALSWGRPLLLGLLCGLALLTKFSSLTTFFLVAGIVFWRLFFLSEIHQNPFQVMVCWLLLGGGVMFLLTGWWFWRNYQLYGEWLAVETHLNLAGRGYLSLPEIWALRAEIERAYWATFGWGQIRPPEPVYQLLGWFTRIGLVGLGLALLLKLVQGDKREAALFNLRSVRLEALLFLLFWVLLNLALYVRWVMEVGSVSHTRLIFPAITAISLLLALGWHSLLPDRFAGGVTVAVIAGLLALNLYSLGGLIYPAFRPSSPTLAGPWNSFGSRLNLTFLESLQLVTGDVHPETEPPPFPTYERNTAQAGETVLIRAGWQTLAPLSKNYSVAALLLAPDGQVLARRESYPGLGLRPTRYLQPGERFVDLYPLTVPEAVTAPLVARAVVTVFDLETETRTGFPALDPQGQTVTPVIGFLKIVPQVWPSYQPSVPVSANFGGVIRLLGYDLDPASRQLTLYWQSLGPIEEDLQLFVHLLDAEGQLLAQADAAPTQGDYPTSWWAPGETIADTHSWPAQVGTERLRLGFYSLSSGQRLPVSESTVPVQDHGVEVRLP